MSNYSLYRGTYENPLVAPILINNDDNTAVKGELFGRYFLVGAAQTDFSPEYPKKIDPHWFPYPKVNWSPSINNSNPNIVWTQFVADKDHYLMYIPTATTGTETIDKEIIIYKNLLRKSFKGPGVNYSDLLKAQETIDSKKKREMKMKREALIKKQKEDALKKRREEETSSRADRALKRRRQGFGKKR